MKKILIIFLLALVHHMGIAQPEIKSKPESIPNVYLGLGTGIDNYSGTVGISGNFRLKNKLFLQSGLGIGGWGGKMSLGLRYDMQYFKGWSYAVGFSHATGIKEFVYAVEVESGGEHPVQFALHPANTLNLKSSCYFKSRKQNNFYLEGGYAIPFQSRPWQVTQGVEPSKNSKELFDILSPGGVILGLGYNFGL